MERATVGIYETRAEEWAERRRGEAAVAAAATAFAARCLPGLPCADLGSGPGVYSELLGDRVVALDAAKAMLDIAAREATGVMLVQADIEAPPFRRGSLGGAWASKSYLHVGRADLPAALARLHPALAPGAPFELTVRAGDYEGNELEAGDFPGRFFACWSPERLAEVVTGAGFAVEEASGDAKWTRVAAVRARWLPDAVGPGMKLLVCGLNPSVVAADAGYGYAGPSNRFWTAAVAAGLVCAEHARRPLDALRHDGIGMTDLVKRATARAAELAPEEYRSGAERVRRLVEWLRPGAVLFVGLAGWRAAVDGSAQPGPQPEPFGGVPAYVMPSTSGLNAHAKPAGLADHIRAALELAAG